MSIPLFYYWIILLFKCFCSKILMQITPRNLTLTTNLPLNTVTHSQTISKCSPTNELSFYFIGNVITLSTKGQCNVTIIIAIELVNNVNQNTTENLEVKWQPKRKCGAAFGETEMRYSRQIIPAGAYVSFVGRSKISGNQMPGEKWGSGGRRKSGNPTWTSLLGYL